MTDDEIREQLAKALWDHSRQGTPGRTVGWDDPRAAKDAREYWRGFAGAALAAIQHPNREGLPRGERVNDDEIRNRLAAALPVVLKNPIDKAARPLSEVLDALLPTVRRIAARAACHQCWHLVDDHSDDFCEAPRCDCNQTRTTLAGESA